MISRLIAVLVLAVSLPLGACAVKPMTDQERAHQLVQGAQLTYKKFKASKDEPMDEFRKLLPKAQGMIILPGVVKGGFVLAAEGGSGVLLAKDDAGNWSQPAFYFLASGSVGFQLGAQVGDVVVLLFSQDAVKAIIDNQGKLGADLNLVVGTVGAGVEASTTTNVGADVMAFTQGTGLFAGGALEAAALIKRNDFAKAFYGQMVEPQEIVFGGAVQNPATEPLRALLAAQ
ncbi:lipid-binding SYLF domain-containing protein [Magnetovibrio sp. PR-2]|uniref:lipid-binding SYLF domain-containing protein n=1 Tax=Magnetovibrio sp. PR-2 TaxID=3120356 RepID=UPI002FCE5B85